MQEKYHILKDHDLNTCDPVFGSDNFCDMLYNIEKTEEKIITDQGQGIFLYLGNDDKCQKAILFLIFYGKFTLKTEHVKLMSAISIRVI